MAKHTEAWGIEVGSNALKALKLVRHGNEAHVADFAVLPFKQVLTTPDLNVDEEIRVALDALIQSHEDILKTPVVLSVPGNMAFARFAKLPPVEPKKIPDMVRFEAVQQIPFPIEQVEWDYQVFQQDDAPDVEVGIFAITKERVLQYLSNFRSVDLEVDMLTLSPLAVFNAFTYDREIEDDADEGLMIMDIGTVSTDVIIVEQGGIWLRTLPLGGNHFTEALMKQFNISFPKAEKLKKEAATSKYAKQIFTAMRGVFSDLVAEVQRSLGYYQSINRGANINKIVGVGSTFRLPGLAKYLKQNLQLEVHRPDGFERLSVEGKREAEFANYALNLGTAYGLALQGLSMEKVSANILPSHVLASRQWKAKQPWIAAAAACFLAAAGVAVFGHFTKSSGYSSEVDRIQNRVDGVVRQAENKGKELNEVETDNPGHQITNLRRVLDYRDLVPGLLTDVSSALLSINPTASTYRPELRDQINDTPRSQRRRLYITQMQYVYVPRPEVEGAEETKAATPQQGQMDERAMMMGRGVGQGMTPGMRGGSMGVGSSASGAQGPSDLDGLLSATHNAEFFFGGSTPPPRIELVISGVSPFAQTPKLLEDQFLAWFEQNKDAPGRPYTFSLPEQPIESTSQVGLDNVGTNNPGNSMRMSGAMTPGMGGMGMSMDRGIPGMREAGRSREFGGMGATGVDGTPERSIQMIPLNELLPERATADEEGQANDFLFTVRVYVNLRSPDDARKQAAPAEPAPAEARQSPNTDTASEDQA